MDECDDAVEWLRIVRASVRSSTVNADRATVLLDWIDEMVETTEQHMRVMDELEAMMLGAGLVRPGDAITPNIGLLRMFLPS